MWYSSGFKATSDCELLMVIAVVDLSHDSRIGRHIKTSTSSLLSYFQHQAGVLVQPEPFTYLAIFSCMLCLVCFFLNFNMDASTERPTGDDILMISRITN